MGSLSASENAIKNLLFIFNLLFVITGIVVLCVGGVVKGVYQEYDQFLDDGFFSVPSLLMAVGSIVLIISFFGCCGAVKENHCMIVTFAIMLVLVFILELSAGIAGYVLKGRAEDVLQEKLNHTMAIYNTPDGKEVTRAWNFIQEKFACCGVDGPNSWTQFNGTVPNSCCADTIGECTATSPSVYTKGCFEALGTAVIDHALTLGGVGVGIAFVQLLGIVLSCSLAKSLRSRYESV